MSWSSVVSPRALLRALRPGACCLLLMAADPVALCAQSHPSQSSDPANVSTARALFEQGLRHVDAAEWSQAAENFSRVLQLRYSAVAAYNLALAHAKLGQSVRALEELRDLLAQPALEPTVRDAAVALQREEGAAVGWLTVTVHGECGACRVLLNDGVLAPTSIGVANPVNPGQHSLSLMSGEIELDSADLTIARGARLDARLDASQQPRLAGAPFEPQAASQPQPAPAGAQLSAAHAAALAPAGQPARDSSGSLFASPWFWGGVGVLAAGAVTLGFALASGGTEASAPVPGDFTPGVLSGEVRR